MKPVGTPVTSEGLSRSCSSSIFCTTSLSRGLMCTKPCWEWAPFSAISKTRVSASSSRVLASRPRGL